MSFVLILLYVILQDGKPQVRLEQIPTRSVETCAEEGKTRIAKQREDPNFIGGLFADCIALSVTEAKK